MLIPETTSALIAAFSFGIVVNAASAVLFLNVRGYGSSIFLDGKRLALIIFLLGAALWAQIDFITILIGPVGARACEIGVIFTTVFDQLARYAIEQHLLWVINAGTGAGVGQYTLQGLLIGRFILGAVYIGFSRHQMDTICAPVSSISAIAIAVVATDAAVIAVLAVRAVSVGLLIRMKNGGQDSARGKAIIAMLIGLAIWMATSVVMLLGISTTDYIFRSTVPAGGLVILIVIVTAGTGVLLDTKARDRGRKMLESPSPLPIATARFITASRPGDYPPSRYEDLKTEQMISSTAFVQPREVPLPGQGLLPMSEPMGGQGVGGVPIQGQLFPPMRSSTAPVTTTKNRPQDKSKPFKTRGRPERAAAVGRLAISNPVLLEGGSNPLDKVTTVDLQTAARQERERRARTANPHLPRYQHEDIMMGSGRAERVGRTTSTSSKEVVAWTPEPALPKDETLAVGSATGSQPSPSGEDLRRRSPRHAPSTTQDVVQSVGVPTQIRVPSWPMQSASTPRGLPQNQYGIVNTSILRSPSLSSSSETSVPEPAKLPLPRRPSDGLPRNPRATSARRPQGNFEQPRQETVMLVNNIVYNDPNSVANVIDGAKEQGLKALSQAPMRMATPTTPPAPNFFPETPGTSISVVNRPRPVPRRSNTLGMDTYFPGHRKTKSAGVLGQRKYALQSNLGSPTALPPLPLPPQTSIRTARPKPNDTKSMTYDEKMVLLFPQSDSTAGSRRRSSVPTFPKTPLLFMANSPTLTANDGRNTLWWGSKETAAVQTRSLFEEQDQAPQEQDSKGTSNKQLSDQAIFDVTSRRIMPQSWPKEAKPSAAMTNGKRASSPVLSPRMSLASATTMDDATVDWGVGHSPVPVHQACVEFDQNRATEVPNEDGSSGPRVISAMTNQSGEIGIMLDTSVARDVGPKFQHTTPVEMDSPATDAMSTYYSGQWHRRVGDETLRFSSRSGRSRRGTPPVPLVLSVRTAPAKQSAHFQAAEASPLPSPEQASQMIKAQLQKYEQPLRGSVESPGQGRLALLHDLEQEMGRQETRWARMQQDLHATRDSLSTLDISSVAGSLRAPGNSGAVDAVSEESHVLPGSSHPPSDASITADCRASYRTRMASSSSSSPSSQDMMSGSRANIWQRRLEEAQKEYMEYAKELPRKRSTNLFSVSKADLGSPTPPESDEYETEDETWRDIPALLEKQAKQKAAAKLLWTAPQAPEVGAGLMWVRSEKPYKQHNPTQNAPLPNLSVRPARRKDDITQPIDSTGLWQRPTPNAASSTSSLWRSPVELQELEQAVKPTPAPETQVPTYYNPRTQSSRTATVSRPLTQRPPRRSRRISTLPDILEDPQPLPDRRGTLGIYQFPWGERSDIASIRPHPAMFMAIPGTMSTRGSAIPPVLGSNADQLELDEYSTSFFDDYDDNEQDESDYSDYADSESDGEGFDESTLWEIASLLRTDDVPSRFSMFPPPANATTYMVADRITEEPGEEEYDDDSVARHNIIVSMEEPDGLQEMPSPTLPSKALKRTQSTLWQATRGTEEALTRNGNGNGLPQPEDWQVYDQMTEKTARVKPKVSAQPGLIEDGGLWMPPPPEIEGSTSPMWVPHKIPESSTPASRKIFNVPEETLPPESLPREAPPEESAAPKEVVSPMAVWEAPLRKLEQQPRKGDHGVGLPHPQDWESYIDTGSTIRTKPRLSEPSVIESVHLWRSPSNEQTGPKNWLQSLKAVAAGRLWQYEQYEGSHSRGDHGVGLPQPHDWDSYDVVKTSSRAKPRVSEPTEIMSMSLWENRGPSETPGPGKWSQPPSAITISTRLWQFERRQGKGEHGVGLPHPQDWERYNITGATTGAKPRQSQPAVVQSVELWQAPRPSATPESKHWLLRPKATAASGELWRATKQLQRGEHPLGLPHPEDWESYDTAGPTTRAKPRQCEPAVIESASLWQAQPAEAPAPPSNTWTPKTRPAPATRAAMPIDRSPSHVVQQSSKMPWPAPWAAGDEDEAGTDSTSHASTGGEPATAPASPRTGRHRRRIVASDTDWEEALQRAVAAGRPVRRGEASPGPVLTPSAPASPEVYGVDEHDGGQEQEVGPVLLARIEALEKERLFAEQWARSSFAATYRVVSGRGS